MSQYTTYFSAPVQVGVGVDNLAVDKINPTYLQQSTVAPGNVVMMKDLTVFSTGLDTSLNGSFTILVPGRSRLENVGVYHDASQNLTAGTVTMTANGLNTFPAFTLSTTNGLDLPFATLSPNNVSNLILGNAVNTVVFTTASLATTGGNAIRSLRFTVTYTFIV